MEGMLEECWRFGEFSNAEEKRKRSSMGGGSYSMVEIM